MKAFQRKKAKRLTNSKPKAKVNQKRSLLQIQNSFAAAIFNPLDSKMRSQTTSRVSVQKIANTLMKPNDRLTSFERLEIYNRQYWFRLINSLYDDFPGVQSLLGDNQFHVLVKAYLTKCPSRSFTLRNLGSRLPEFIKKNPKYCAKRFEIILEMAKFEWAQIEAFDGPSYPLLNSSVLGLTSPEKLKLHLQSYITLLELNYTLDDFIVSLRKEQSQKSEAGSEKTKSRKARAAPMPKRKKIFLAVHRFENSIYYKHLEKPAFILLSELKKGTKLGKACEKASSHVPKSKRNDTEMSAKIHDWFSVWNNLGWFCVPST